MSKATYLKDLNHAHFIESSSRSKKPERHTKTWIKTAGLKSVTRITEKYSAKPNALSAKQIKTAVVALQWACVVFSTN